MKRRAKRVEARIDTEAERLISTMKRRTSALKQIVRAELP